MTIITNEMAKKATIELANDIDKTESPIKRKPDFTKVKSFGTKYGHKAEQIVKSTPGAVIFGRSVELSQMPDSNIKQRGYTKDIDIFVPNQHKFVHKATKTLGKDYKVTKRESGNYLIERKDGVDAFDIHDKPDSYASKTRKDGYINALPSSTSEMLKRGGITSEKLYVQAKRKAVATLGKSNSYEKTKSKKSYGPSEHRIKDPYDLVRYGNYFASIKTKQLRKLPKSRQQNEKEKIARINKNVDIISAYFAQKSVNSKYEDGQEYGKKFKKFLPKKKSKQTYSNHVTVGVRKRTNIKSSKKRFIDSLLGW